MTEFEAVLHRLMLETSKHESTVTISIKDACLLGMVVARRMKPDNSTFEFQRRMIAAWRKSAEEHGEPAATLLLGCATQLETLLDSH